MSSCLLLPACQPPSTKSQSSALSCTDSEWLQPALTEMLTFTERTFSGSVSGLSYLIVTWYDIMTCRAQSYTAEDKNEQNSDGGTYSTVSRVSPCMLSCTPPFRFLPFVIFLCRRAFISCFVFMNISLLPGQVLKCRRLIKERFVGQEMINESRKFCQKPAEVVVVPISCNHNCHARCKP